MFCRYCTKNLPTKLNSFKKYSSAVKTTPIQVNGNNVRKEVLEYRHIYPEFLPDPKIEFRNALREKLERHDMLARRAIINMPEFYVGTIMAVESSDEHSPGKPHRFVGICIQRRGCGLRAEFILRNVIDHQGVEILYKLYDPSIQKIEILRLEKRIDNELFYLRDALPEYSTFDPNMEVEILPEGSPIPINKTKVKLKPRPWLEKWERKNLWGIQDLELPEKYYEKAKKVATPWEKYDLMKEYMRTIPEEEQYEIYSEIEPKLQKLQVQGKKMKKRVFVRPMKLA
ncbi:39S ribosomal protein L19, mitochondrial [Diorhabda sublineata]|uniref:39S ribosomal protein L19, mitochondrial n=1 Tax=Diorhabda sublineata TaxID=1163346 RepID=UPI0024E095B9|nr:39S ribosomal protein L19, mitochondrial [Diorhabda sublineata]